MYHFLKACYNTSSLYPEIQWLLAQKHYNEVCKHHRINIQQMYIFYNIITYLLMPMFIIYMCTNWYFFSFLYLILEFLDGWILLL